MINNLKLKFGSADSQPPLELDVTPITVFVGPNNSGKSRVLIEIENYCKRSFGQANDLILENLTFDSYTEPEINNEIQALKQIPAVNETINPGHVLLGKVNPQNNSMIRIQIDRNRLVQESKNPNTRRANLFGSFLSMFTVRMDGTNRLNLLSEQNAGDLQKTPVNHLSHLFINNDLRKEVRRIIFDAFNKYFVIDPTNIGKLRVRLSDREPSDEREEKGWDQISIDFHKESAEIIHASDGVKAFTGIISTILAGDPKVALIDEPEAFLHPALSYKLGREIANALKGSKKRLFVSTHSSSFLMGCIQSGLPLNIIRLTYNYSVPTARILQQDKIIPLMRNPLLRSTGVLNGLFYESVVVTESDSDRAFYQEINERLLNEHDDRGIHSCLFVNAQNKQTVWDIVKPLRELGIPTLGIVDIDVIKDGGQVWNKPLKGAFIPEISHQSFQDERKAIFEAFKRTNKDMKRDGGIKILIGQEREACENLFSKLLDYGVLIVPGGELESWLNHLSVTGHGSKWLIDIFEKMGDDPESADYLKPSDNDVWDFLGLAKQWLRDSKRKGIPQ